MKWISVKERLPDVKDQVLIATDDGTVHEAFLHASKNYFEDGRCCCETIFWLREITYWAPWPTSPKD